MNRSKNNFDIFALLIIILLMISPPSYFSQNGDSNVKIRLDSLFISDFFKTSQIAIDVYNLKEDKPVYSKNEKLLVRPASVEKILTTSAALKFLGSDYNFSTKIYHTGEVEDSICTGNIFIVGGFDPLFSQKDLDSTVSEIKKYGIKEIKGNVYADVSAGDSLFWGEGWMWDDDPGSFAAYLSPLNINQNCINIIYSPGELNQPASVQLSPQNNFIKIINNSITIDSGKSSINISRDWINRKNILTVTGSISKTDLPDTASVNIFNPAFYFLQLMNESFERHNIIFNCKIDTLTMHGDSEEIFSLERNIDDVIVYTNKRSYNLGAEMILRAIALNNFIKPASAEKGILLVDSLISIIGFDSKIFRIADGSGLSFYNLVSAELVTGLLKYFYQHEEDLFVKLYNSFPVAGFDGTLRNRMKDSPIERRVRAKTGTLSGASNLAGYLQSKTGDILAFSIFVQNYVGSANRARLIQEKICQILFEEL